MDPRDPPKIGLFEETRWTVIANLHGDEAARASALERLCGAYRRPLLVYAQASLLCPEDAEDVVQDFLAAAVRRNLFAKADQERGKLRTFLLAGLHQQIVDWRRRQGTVKRGGQTQIVSLNSHNESDSNWHPLDLRSPDQLFAREWMLTLIDRATTRMRQKWEQAGKGQSFEALLLYLLESPTAAQKFSLTAQLSISAGHLSVMLHRFRREFANTLRHTVAQTVTAPQDIDEELRDLGWRYVD